MTDRDEEITPRRVPLRREPRAPGTNVRLPPLKPAAKPDAELVREAVASVRPPKVEQAPATQQPKSEAPSLEVGIKVRNLASWVKVIGAIGGLAGAITTGVVTYLKTFVEPQLAELRAQDERLTKALEAADARAVALSQRQGASEGALRAIRCRGNVLGNIVVRLGYDPGWKIEPVLWSSQRLPDKPKSAPTWVAADDDECDNMPELDKSSEP